MLYKLINPSDPYTLEAFDFQIACLANYLLSHGWYGLESEDGNGHMPPLFYATQGWYHERFDADPKLDLQTPSILRRVADCLDSFLIGNFKDRQGVMQNLASLTYPPDAQKYKLEYHDGRRSSINDIGRAAWELAENCRKEAEKIQRRMIREARNKQ